MSLGPFPRQASIVVNDLVDNCAQIKPGQHVLILAANDGLHGGINVVDRETVAWIEAGVQARGAQASVLWTDMPSHSPVLWGEGADPMHAWRVPSIIKGAWSSADIVISHITDLSFEEGIKEIQEISAEVGVPMVRNMATTTSLFTSTWALCPYELVSELRLQAAALVEPGREWLVTHANGTQLRGTVAAPRGSGNSYVRRRGRSIPFPEGVFPSISSVDAEGIAVIEEIGVTWAQHIGLGPVLRHPVRFTIEKGMICAIEGGEEADMFRRFYKFMSRYLGDAAYQMRGFHGGVHPWAQLAPHQCPDESYRRLIEHHHWSSFHIHLGNSAPAREYPYHMHISGELRGGTLKVGDNFIYNEGRLSAVNHPTVQQIANKYPDRPALASLW